MRSPEIALSDSEYKSLHSTGSSSTTVAYRDGHEVHDADAQKNSNDAKPSASLTTSGEFGPILSVVLGDAMRGTVAWQRWEQGASDPVAVFRYAVPAEQSNYRVGIPSGGKFEDVYPGYRGEIAIDPATGAILRIGVMAEFPAPYQAMQNAILVEYAPVTIGEQSYICPVHGVAFSRIPVAQGAAPRQEPAVDVQTQLNDVVFTQYRVFGPEARIVTNESGTGDAPPAPTPADHQP
jgi:hypothetical protein